MGFEFIYRVKRNLRKGWDREYTRLSQSDLTRRAATETRTITVKPQPECTLGPNDVYELRLCDDGLDVYRDGKLVAQGGAPPASVTSEIRDHGGIALGTFHEAKPHSGLAEIAVSPEPPVEDQ
jgi:hypothetical protein